MEKKHGLKIIEKGPKKNKNKNNIIKKSQTTGFGFYGFLTLFLIFVITIFGVINLTKDIIIDIYPQSETYINYLYEIIEILNSVIFQLFSNF